MSIFEGELDFPVGEPYELRTARRAGGVIDFQSAYNGTIVVVEYATSRFLRLEAEESKVLKVERPQFFLFHVGIEQDIVDHAVEMLKEKGLDMAVLISSKPPGTEECEVGCLGHPFELPMF